jgi:curved DNA-binding protein CbpA
MQDEDLYAVLGVSPDAEHVVIVAAYRALAQRYHPDRWKGDPEFAHVRMSEINAAYEVLGDSVRRQEYDKERRAEPHQEFEPERDRESEAAFSTALRAIEERWSTACSVFPDLHELRSDLESISSSLAFEYVVHLLETKQFSHRVDVALELRNRFLERYFGRNAELREYALGLIRDGHRDAARSLNRLIATVGSDVDSKLLISKTERDFGLGARRAQQNERKAQEARSNAGANGAWSTPAEMDSHIEPESRTFGENVLIVLVFAAFTSLMFLFATA